jgi:hypothetical protein
MTSVLMVGQFYVERYFSKGFGTKQEKARATAENVGHGH